MLSLVRSMKNTFALINKTPPEVLFLIPTYWEDSDRAGGSIKLTHVCHSWRGVFTSCPSLWTRLDCGNVDKTRVYLERSKRSPLEIRFEQANDASHRENAFLLAVPHIDRLKTLLVSGNLTQILPVLARNFFRPAPILEKLEINLGDDQSCTLPGNLFDRDLSSLRELNLAGVITSLSWRGLSNLSTFNLTFVPEGKILLTQLLDFFEATPHLRHIKLRNSIPNSSNAPIERVVSLPHLRELSIIAQPAHSILLNHLSIPAGASLHLEFTFSGGESPIPSYLPKSPNLHNFSHFTTVNLRFGSGQRYARLNGPGGELYILGHWARVGSTPHTGTGRFIQSLDQFDISRGQRLAITLCGCPPPSASIETWPAYRTFFSMEDLRSVTLTQCNNVPFILALNPSKNPSKDILCHKLEEIVLYIQRPDQVYTKELLSMAEERALRGVKLPAITIISTDALAPMKEVFRLRKHVSRVEYKFENEPPRWDALPTQAI